MTFSTETKFVLINCDDMGYHPSINDAIIDVLNGGVVKSLSLMATGPYFDDAVDKLHRMGIKKLGAHLVLAAEYPVLPMYPVSGSQLVPSLVDIAGKFYQDISKVRVRAKNSEIRYEVVQQLNKILNAGFSLTHVDGHMFWYESDEGGIEMHNLVADICQTYNLPLRSSSKHYSRKIKQVEMYWDDFESIEQRSHQYRDYFETLEKSVSELIIHPALNPEVLARFTRTGDRRIADHHFFSNVDLKHWFSVHSITPITWPEVPGKL